jgi:hypothetical protein
MSRFRWSHADISKSSNISILQDGLIAHTLGGMSDIQIKSKKEERVQFLTTAEQVQALEDWMFSKRIRSQGEAIRRLIELGMQADQSRQSSAA